MTNVYPVLTEGLERSHYVLVKSSDQEAGRRRRIEAFSILLDNELSLIQNRALTIKTHCRSSNAPVDTTLRQRLVWLFITDFMEVMKSHQGYNLELKHRSLQTTFNLFLRAQVDLICALDEFDRLSRSVEFLPRTNTARTRIQDKIRKELYCFSSLAHSLQDHCRRLSDDWNQSYIKAAIVRHFGDDGLHDFICGLRSALHHRQMAEADWTIKKSGQEMTSHYDFDKSELLDIQKCWNANAKSYLSGCAKKVDIRELCVAYSERAEYRSMRTCLHRFWQTRLCRLLTIDRLWMNTTRKSCRRTGAFLSLRFITREFHLYKHLHMYLDEKDLIRVRATRTGPLNRSISL